MTAMLHPMPSTPERSCSGHALAAADHFEGVRASTARRKRLASSMRRDAYRDARRAGFSKAVAADLAERSARLGVLLDCGAL